MKAEYEEKLSRAEEEGEEIRRAAQRRATLREEEILREAEAYLLSKMPIVPVVYNQNYYLVEDIGSLDFDGYGNPVFTTARLR